MRSLAGLIVILAVFVVADAVMAVSGRSPPSPTSRWRCLGFDRRQQPSRPRPRYRCLPTSCSGPTGLSHASDGDDLHVGTECLGESDQVGRVGGEDLVAVVRQ